MIKQRFLDKSENNKKNHILCCRFSITYNATLFFILQYIQFSILLLFIFFIIGVQLVIDVMGRPTQTQHPYLYRIKNPRATSQTLHLRFARVLKAAFESRRGEEMGVYTFVCRSSDGEWTGKQLSGDLEASASSTFDLQRSLVKAAAAADSSGGVSSSFSMVTPFSAVFQVLLRFRC